MLKTVANLASITSLMLSGVVGFGATDPTRAFFESEAVGAKSTVGSIPLSGTAAFWAAPKASEFRAFPQRTVRLNDANANAGMDGASPINFKVKVATTSTELGVWVEWKDSTRTTVDPLETNAFGDSSAIQFPEKFGKGIRLPHVGMGDEKSQVRVYMQRAAQDATLANEYVGRGFGSLTRTSKAVARMKMEFDEKASVWRAVFARPLSVSGTQSLKAGLVPIAFAFWDGAGKQRGGNKFLSNWKFLRVVPAVEKSYLKEASFGFNPGDLGSVEQGKAKAAQLCAGCHWVGESASAPAGMAPDLRGIGGYANASYIRDSIMDPGAVVVRNLQLNRHYNKAADPDENRAYPNNEMYQWYIDLGNGNKMSKMPNLNLPPQDVADLVAYLKTQDGAVAPGR